MRQAFATLALLCAVLMIASGTNFAQEKSKEVILKGTITCAKCDLKLQKTCATVIVVKKDNKDTVYYFDTGSNKKFHGDTCTESKKGTVVGTVSMDGKKKVVSVSKLTYE